MSRRVPSPTVDLELTIRERLSEKVDLPLEVRGIKGFLRGQPPQEPLFRQPLSVQKNRFSTVTRA